MNKKYGKIVLALILAVQIMTPFSIMTAEKMQEARLQKYGKEIKLQLESVSYDGTFVTVECDGIDDAMCFDYDAGYVGFQERDNGYYDCVVLNEEPTDGIYLKQRKDKIWRYLEYEIEMQNEIGYCFWELYDALNEEENINNGKCQGPATQAYMLLRVYKNKYKCEGVFIDGVKVEEIVEKYYNDEIDLSRYQSNYDYIYDGKEVEPETSPETAA